MGTHRSLGQSLKGRSFRELVENDLDIMPLMNLFVALIPMLLISAVFLRVTVIDMDAPPEGQAAVQDEALLEPLHLAVTIRPGAFVIEGNKLSQVVIDRAAADADTRLETALADIVTGHPQNREVMIISAADTRYDDIIAVMDITRSAGLPSASLLGAD